MRSVYALGAIILGAIFLQAGNGLLTVLVPLRLSQEGTLASIIGLVGAGYSAGFLFGCLYAPRLVRNVGHIRAFAALAAVMAISALGMTQSAEPLAWGAARTAMGFCMAGLTAVIESWISDRTPAERRGSMLSTYMLLYKIAMIGGPLLLAYGDPASADFLILVGALFTLSLIPVSLTRGSSPDVPKSQRLGLFALFRMTPVSVAGCFMIGVSNASVMNLAPSFAASIGMTAGLIAVAMGAVQLGGLIMQWPVGWLSDRRDRRHVIIGVSVAASAAAFVLSFSESFPAWGQVAALFAWGSAALTIYAVCIAHGTDRVPRELMVAACSSLLLAYGVGAVIGPAFSGFIMTLVGPAGLFHVASVVPLIYAAYVVYRISVRRAAKPEEQEEFVGLPASGPLIHQLDPRIDADGPSDPAGPEGAPRSAP